VFLGGLALAVYARLRGRRLWAGWPALGAAVLAGLFFALDLGLWHRSVLYVGPGLGTILANFQVFAMALAGVLWFRERPGWRLALGIPLALAGLWLLVGAQWGELGPRFHLGVGLGLLTACAYSGYLLSLRWAVRRREGLAPEANLALVSLACAAILLPAVLRSGESLAAPTLADWGWLLIYGVVCHALGWVLISRGLMSLPASRAGLVLLLQPTLAFVWDLLFFARPTTWLEAGGAALAVIAIYLGAISRPAAYKR
jgi:drug/metabolite transporter (DMT)-like permease